MEYPFGVSQTSRPVSEGAESVLFQPIPVRNDRYSVTLVDYMGNDDSIVDAATLGFRGSAFHECPSGIQILGELSALGLQEPFKAVQLKFLIRAPIDPVALHLIYDPSCSVNEMSGRYSELFETSYPDGTHPVTEIYKELLSLNLTRELARLVLPTGNDTAFYWKIDLPSLVNLIKRKDLYADSLTLEFFLGVEEIASTVAPESWKALFSPVRSNLSCRFSGKDLVDSEFPLNSELKNTFRRNAPSLEEVLQRRFPYLDHGQFIAVDYMGNDCSIPEAARISYSSATQKSKDESLIRYLVRHQHTSPLEMIELSFFSKTPLFVDPRQAARHRMLDNFGFMGRTPLGSERYFPERNELRAQSTSNKQGRSDLLPLDKQEEVIALLMEAYTQTDASFASYTKRWRTGDGKNLMHFLDLRLDSHAQKEMQLFAQLVDDALSRQAPILHQAFLDYVKNVHLPPNLVKEGSS
jgi:thymidylate synthase (FAD)